MSITATELASYDLAKWDDFEEEVVVAQGHVFVLIDGETFAFTPAETANLIGKLGNALLSLRSPEAA